MSHCPNI